MLGSVGGAGEIADAGFGGGGVRGCGRVNAGSGAWVGVERMRGSVGGVGGGGVFDAGPHRSHIKSLDVGSVGWGYGLDAGVGGAGGGPPHRPPLFPT